MKQLVYYSFFVQLDIMVYRSFFLVKVSEYTNEVFMSVVLYSNPVKIYLLCNDVPFLDSEKTLPLRYGA